MRTKIIIAFIIFAYHLSAQEVGINILNPTYALDIKAINDEVLRLQSRSGHTLFEGKGEGTFGFNVNTDGVSTIRLKPSSQTTVDKEVLAILNHQDLPVFGIQENGRVGIQTFDPFSKLHIAGGNGNTISDFGDVVIGDINNSLRFGIFTSGAGEGWASITNNGNGVRQLTLRAGSTPMNIDGLNGRFGFGFTSVPSSFFHVKQINNYDAKFESTQGDVDLILDTYTGNTSVEFQENGTFKGSVGYDSNEERIFIYSGGNVMFAKEGKFYLPHLADADKLMLKITEDGEIITDKKDLNTWTFGAVNFLTSEYNGNELHFRVNLYGIGATAAGALSSNNSLYTSVHLPKGAEIKKMKIIFVDNDAVGNIKVEFYKTPILDNVSDLIISTTTSGQESALRSKAVAMDEKIDNVQNAYFIKVSPTNGNWQNAGFKQIQAIQLSEDSNLN
ncbi:MAG: hypothetical protein AAGK97_00115 [Bacteroidota bacterium]